MSPAQLLVHFDRVSEAPGAVPRLRRFILDLAVRGKLVEQDPNDDARQCFDRSLKEIETYDIPRTWTWARVGDTADCRLGKMLDKGKNRGTPRHYLRNVNVRWFDFDLTNVPLMPFEDAELEEFRLQSGDVLVCEGGEPGRAAVWDERVSGIYFQKAIHRVRFRHSVDPQFFVRVLRALADNGTLARHFTGVGIKHLTGRGLSAVLFPLPPLAEQRRIMVRVNELMALCDRLEAAQAERERRRDRVVVESLDRLNAATRPAELCEAARFHLHALPRLLTREEHFDRLRDTILELAVTGRLTRRQPGDGDGETLLRNLARSVKGNRKASVAAEAADALPALPENWKWAVTNDLAAAEPNTITDGPFGANLKTAHYIQTPGYRVIRLQNVGHGEFRDEHRAFVDEQHFKRLAKHHVSPGDLVVAGLVDPLVRCCELPQDIGPALVKADCYRFKVHPGVSSRFVLHYMNSPVCQRFASSHHHGMTLLRIGLGNFRRIPIPVPPLAEQLRIVATVDALLVVCDKLEAQLTVAETESSRLLEAVLNQALAAA